jgi:hypothetical protein
MDQVGEQEDAIDGTRNAFKDVIEGDPIGFNSPGVLAALQDLEAARMAEAGRRQRRRRAGRLGGPSGPGQRRRPPRLP